MQTVLLDVGSGHSGSTLLGVLLGKHKDVLSLGEISNVLNGKPKSLENVHEECSCGKKLKECPIWSVYLENRNVSVDGSFIDQYRDFFSIMQGKRKVIAESGKIIRHLRPLWKLHQEGVINLRVLLLVKDVRGYAVSAVSRAKYGGSKYPRFLLYFFYYRKWLRHNRGLQAFMRKHKIPYEIVTYEDLCLNTEETMERVLSYAGVSAKKYDLNGPADDHIAYGNRMKVDPKKRNNIRYDRRWFYSSLTQFFYGLMIPVRRYNERIRKLSK